MFTHNTLNTVQLGNVCVLVQHALRPAFFSEILQKNQEQRCGPAGFHSQISLIMKDCQNMCTPHSQKSGKPPPGGAKTLQALVHFSLADLSPLPGFSVVPITVYLHINSHRNHTLNLVLCQHSLISAAPGLRPKGCFKTDVLDFHFYFFTFSRFSHPLSFLFGIILF